MQIINGLYFPADDFQMGPQIEKYPLIDGKGTFQYHKYKGALPHIRNFRHAVDAGAHCGTWSRVMALDFARLSAFEPLPLHRECFMLNVPASEKCDVALYDCGLGAEEATARMFIKAGKSATSKIKKGGTEEVRIIALDSLELTDVDFIKIDVEGYEASVVRGAEQTIRLWKPAIIVEQKPGNAENHGFEQYEAVEMLKSWGASQVWNIGNDILLRWE